MKIIIADESVQARTEVTISFSRASFVLFRLLFLVSVLCLGESWDMFRLARGCYECYTTAARSQRRGGVMCSLAGGAQCGTSNYNFALYALDILSLNSRTPPPRLPGDSTPYFQYDLPFSPFPCVFSHSPANLI